MHQMKKSLTNVVPAAPGGGATDPVPLENVDLPVAFRVVIQGVGAHVADLHLVIVPLEVLKLHPGVKATQIKPFLCGFCMWRSL